MAAIQESAVAAASQPEPAETVMAAVAKEREHRATTTSIGTVLALRSITLRNEVAGTVRSVTLTPGQIMPSGTVLVALGVSVEQAELEAQEAQAALARSTLERLERLRQQSAASEEEADRGLAPGRQAGRACGSVHARPVSTAPLSVSSTALRGSP
jgi:membrane fusion protein (multidrug efflux system)